MGQVAQAWLLLCVLVTPLAASPLPPNSTSLGAGAELRPGRARAPSALSALGIAAPRPGLPWFQYPDDDTAKIGAAYRYIGEQPVFLAASEGPLLAGPSLAPALGGC